MPQDNRSPELSYSTRGEHPNIVVPKENPKSAAQVEAIAAGHAAYGDSAAAGYSVEPVAWDTAATYAAGDVATFDGDVYVAIDASTSTDDDPATETALWAILDTAAAGSADTVETTFNAEKEVV